MEYNVYETWDIFNGTLKVGLMTSGVIFLGYILKQVTKGVDCLKKTHQEIQALREEIKQKPSDLEKELGE